MKYARFENGRSVCPLFGRIAGTAFFDDMKIICYECGKTFESANGFYLERRVMNPEAIPAVTKNTGYGYCSEECAERHHLLEHNNEIQDFGNYEETQESVVMSSPDGGVRGEVLRVQELRKHRKERDAA